MASENKDPDQTEEEFHEFTRKLLNAQKRNFFEGKPLTRESFRRTLTEICNLLAEKTRAESVTVHLKIYDPVQAPTLQDRIRGRPADDELNGHYPDGDRKLFQPAAPSNGGRRPRAFRDDPLVTSLAFPFSALPRGALQLMACSERSPWNVILPNSPLPSDFTKEEPLPSDFTEEEPPDRDFTEEEKVQLSIVHLHRGISAEIVQDNRPRKRGRTKLLASRGDRKLGFNDALIWTNKGIHRMFRNYYGVPIKLHLDGEVIGLLKLENKSLTGKVGDSPKTIGDFLKQLREVSPEPNSSQSNSSLIGYAIELLRMISEESVGGTTWTTIGQQLAESGVSILAMAYLQDDLEQAARALGTDNNKDAAFNALFPSYPHVKRMRGESTQHNTSKIESLLPPDREAPPIQFWARNEAGEQWLSKSLMRKTTTGIGIKKLLAKLSKFREKLNLDLRKFEAKNARSRTEKELTFNFDGVQLQVARTRANGTLLAPFTYRLTGSEEKISHEFYAIIPPAVASTLRDSRVSKEHWSIFYTINPKWRLKKVPLASVKRFFYVGERVSAVTLATSEGAKKTTLDHELPDLLVDRLAARVQALIYALPTEDFDGQDSRMLTLAVREVGNLVQKEILYRGNLLDDSMPLTNFEFDRLPLSDQSFVDDLRVRVERAKSFMPNLDHHITNLIDECGMTRTVHYSSRVKEYRSHLARLGERHEGHIRGAMAIWCFLLGGLVTSDSSENAKASLPQRLKAFSDLVCEHVPKIAGANFILSEKNLRHVLQLVLEWNRNPQTLPFADLGFLSHPWRDAYHIREQPLWKMVADGLQHVGYHDEAQFTTLYDGDVLDAATLSNAVLRNHEPYVQQASSLLIQLYQSASRVDSAVEARHSLRPNFEFINFYHTMFELRRVLSYSPLEIEQLPQLAPLKKIYAVGEATEKNVPREALWISLVDYAVIHSTDEFINAFAGELVRAGAHDQERARLSPGGIFKRIRTLNYRLREQQSTAHLEWRLGRLDLMGCRIDCLFKNQVSALYEDLWDRGDPFRGRDADAKLSWNTGQRTRWLCVRTNAHYGEYNALQIAALVDPTAVQRGFWDGDPNGRTLPDGAVYNLSLLRLYWSTCLRELSDDEKPFKQNYFKLACNRRMWIDDYVTWFKSAERFLKDENVEVDSFDVFPGGAVIGLVLWALAKLRTFESSAGNRPSKLAAELQVPELPLPHHSEINRIHSEHVVGIESCILVLGLSVKSCLESIRDRTRMRGALASLLEDNWDEPTCFETKQSVSRLVSKMYQSDLPSLVQAWYRGSVASHDEYEDCFLNEIDSVIETEKGQFNKTDDNEALLNRAARGIVFFVRGLTDEEFESICKGLASRDLELQLRAWERFRRSQKDYLFWLGKGLMDGSGDLRSRDNILARLENYTLLWNSELLESEQNGNHHWPVHMRYWNSRDLFYYVRSLLPVEIQVRTLLASVHAEQYHDRVYKHRSSARSLVPVTRMHEVANNLDNIDKELEMDFEDYVERESRC